MSFIKIINYFFFRPLNNVLILIINNFKGKYFAIFFNMYSFFSLNFIYISFENNFFKLKYKSRYWYFAHRSRAWIYLKGLKIKHFFIMFIVMNVNQKIKKSYLHILFMEMKYALQLNIKIFLPHSFILRKVEKMELRSIKILLNT